MPRRKFNLRTLLLLLLIPVPAILIGLQHERLNGWGVRTIDVIASLPEAGGFQPASKDVAAGETVILRFHAQDVTHGVAIGPGLGVDTVDASRHGDRAGVHQGARPVGTVGRLAGPSY